jgi:hypothetical protein
MPRHVTKSEPVEPRTVAERGRMHSFASFWPSDMTFFVIVRSAAASITLTIGASFATPSKTSP